MDQKPDWADLLVTYQNGPVQLREAVEGLSQKELGLSIDDDNWTIREITHHIVEGDDLFIPFIKQALGGLGGKYHLDWYFEQSQIEWGKCWGFDRRNIKPALALFRANREHTTSILEGVKEPGKYKLNITWPDGTNIDYGIDGIIQIQVNHLKEHLEDIQNILLMYQA